MSHSYPIWNSVESRVYKNDKSYGARDDTNVQVFVGTSASNSEILVEHLTTRRIVGDYTVFRFSVDTGSGLVLLKTKYMHTKSRVWYDKIPTKL